MTIIDSMKRISLIAAALAVMALTGAAAEIQFTASVDQTTVGLGDQFSLNLTVAGEDMSSVPRPELPSLPDFNLLGQTQSSSTNVAINNGQIKKEFTVTFIYVLSAKKLGKLTIPAGTLKYGGKEYQSQPIEISVVKASQVQAAPRQQQMPGRAPQAAANVPVEGNLYVDADISRNNVYVGEQINLLFTLYSRLQISRQPSIAIPPFNGFWKEDLKINGSPSQQTVNGKVFNKYPLLGFALFPMSPGKLAIQPLKMGIPIVTQSRDIFDFFGTEKIVDVESKPVVITVLPLPEPKPRDFSGGVGQFSISASLDRTASSNNEPLNLTVKITGTGNIRLIEKPVIPAIPGLKVLEPEVKEDIRAAGDVIRGTRTFRYPIMPQADGKYVIPALSLSYFDPAGKSYKTVSTSPYECTASGCNQNAPLAEATGLRVLGSDINYIKPDARSLNTDRPLPAVLLAVVYFLSVALLGASFWYRAYQLRLQNDQGFARKTRSSALVKRRLKQAESFLKKHDDKAFYAALSQAVIGYAGDRYNIETQAMTKEQLLEALARLGVGQDTIARLIGIVEQCEIARFSPGLLSVKDPGELFAQAKSILSEL